MRAGRIGFVVASIVIIAGCGVTLPVSLGDKAYPEHSNDWPNEQSAHPSVNANGTIIAFASDASNLTPDDTDHVTDVFVTRAPRLRS